MLSDWKPLLLLRGGLFQGDRGALIQENAVQNVVLATSDTRQ
jgi:hypothetical protein